MVQATIGQFKQGHGNAVRVATDRDNRRRAFTMQLTLLFRCCRICAVC